MYRINFNENRLQEVAELRFQDMQAKERSHLQEWLANCPEAFGEELLVIQKEFDGFVGTSERLDLLALDKQGNLVIIENKLDDSGRDTVWQALKYAAYCSTLKAAEIVTIFQSYLNVNGGGEAEPSILEFLDKPTLEEAELNVGNAQRIILVARSFRKEVTATAMWLLTNNIALQCFTVKPFQLGEEYLLDVRQIIPVPEAADFIISMSSKEKEESQSKQALSNAQKLRYSFWTQALERLREDPRSRYQNVSPGRDHWLSCGSGLSGCNYALIFAQHEVRVELNLARVEKEENKALFDALYSQRLEIEQAFDSPLLWQRLDDRKACRIKFAQPFDGYDQGNWPEMITWLVTYFPKLEAALDAPLQLAADRLRAGTLL